MLWFYCNFIAEIFVLTEPFANNTVVTKPVFTWSHLPLGLLKKRWVYHSFFWLIYYLFYSVVIVFAVFHVSDIIFYIQLLFFASIDIALVYFNFYILIPRLLSTKKYLYYGLLLALAIVVVSFINLSLKQLFLHFGSELYTTTASFTPGNIILSLTERFYFIGLTTAIKLAKDWIQNEQRLASIREQMKEKEKQYLEAELNFLKSQIQPHFFFNTLNNLYSLTLKNQTRRQKWC